MTTNESKYISEEEKNRIRLFDMRMSQIYSLNDKIKTGIINLE